MNLLYKGIELAEQMQKAIVRVGTSLVEKREVKTQTYFRYVIIENSLLKDIELFQYPLALHKLALFVLQVHKVSLSFSSPLTLISFLYPQAKFAKTKVKPLVISVKNPTTKTTLVIAADGSSKDADTNRK